jgi:hypothetical protein
LVLTMTNAFSLYRLLAVAFLMMLTACSVSPYQPTSPEVIEPMPASEHQAAPDTASEPAPAAPSVAVPEQVPQTYAPPPKSTPTQAEFVQKPAVTALLAQASQAEAVGDYQQAQQHIQRAQRISPTDPSVYYELAKTHLALGSYGLAEQVALKGISVAQGYPNALGPLWQLVAESREASGNLSGARTARQKAQQY